MSVDVVVVAVIVELPESMLEVADSVGSVTKEGSTDADVVVSGESEEVVLPSVVLSTAAVLVGVL